MLRDDRRGESQLRRGVAVLVLVLLTGGLVIPTELSAQPQISQTLNCAAHALAGAVDCEVTESWIAVGSFPQLLDEVWPPEGYKLIRRGLLSQTSTQNFCVVFIRSLQHVRTPAYSETTGPLPQLHEGFSECPPQARLTPNATDYEAVVRSIRKVLPRPTFSVKPRNSTLVGIHTLLDMPERPLLLDEQVRVELPSGPKNVRIRAQGSPFVRWRASGETTGPHSASINKQTQPAFQYNTSGDELIDVIDAWTVEVSAEGLPTFTDIVYLGYPPLQVRVNELVITVERHR